ncbi:MAG: hypothetical protein LBJ73_05450 [Rickettsiales bacterium]|jgi:hypothetical protein|nr:hypothetical protein [Rickettsiales bacterium]
MKAQFLIFIGILLSNPVFADVLELDVALSNVRENCIGIASELNHMKTMAGINTVVTSVGTLAGGGATVVGFVKQSRDKELEELEKEIAELKRLQQESQEQPTQVDISDEQISELARRGRLMANGPTNKNEISDKQSEYDTKTQQSKNLGNWRTGLMAGSTATNVAGAVIASGNKVKGDLKSQIDACRKSVEDLRASFMQARMYGKDITIAQNIINNCKGWDTFDASKINNKASSAMWSSVVGATTGAVGTITSAIANTDKTRNDNTDSGKSKERNLNTASNILAIGTTVASGTATVFNATQISAIKKASEIADNCEGAIR